MNKVQLSEVISEKVGLTQKQVEAVLEAFVDTVIKTLRDGGKVSLSGFGAFLTKRRVSRIGVNPRNPSEKIQIPAVTVPKFKAGKRLKEGLKNIRETHTDTDSQETGE